MFLRFSAQLGSGVITRDSIRYELYSFFLLEGLQRRSVAHTCVPILELPKSYEYFPALAEEFTNITKESQRFPYVCKTSSIFFCRN